MKRKSNLSLGLVLLLALVGFFTSILLFKTDSDVEHKPTANSQSTEGQNSSLVRGGINDDSSQNSANLVTDEVIESTNDRAASRSPDEPRNALALARTRWAEDHVALEKSITSEKYHKASFYIADDFKYERIRFDETFSDNPESNSEAQLLDQVAYVADHFLIRVVEEQRGLIKGILAAFPELSIRHELSTGNHLLIEFPIPDYKRDYFAFWSGRLSSRGLNPEKDRLTFHTAVPFDQEYINQWALNNTGQNGGTDDADIDAQEAWDIQTGSENVIIAVVDTGVDLQHDDLRENLWTFGTGATQIKGRDFVNGGSNPDDIDGHGTHVAGVIGAKSDNTTNIAGINWNVSIMPVKVLNDFGVGTTSDVISGLDFAAAYGASIVNMSLGSSGGGTNTNQDAFYVELKEARDLAPHGVLVVAAAGNDGLDNDTEPQFPAGYDLANIIAVASTDDNDAMSGFSNYGATTVDLAAPGSSILSTLPDNLTGELSGTSMAAPHVAGVAGLIKAQDPDLNYLEIKNLILNTVDQLPSQKGKTLTEGRLNANNALLSFTGANALISTINLRPLGGDDNNGDALLVVGESMLVDVVVSNPGNATATNVSLDIEIVQGDTYATLTGPANINLADIATGGSVVVESAFELTAEDLDPFDFKKEIEIKITLNYDSRTHAKYTTYTIYQAATLSGFVYDGADGVTPIEGALVEVIAETAAGVFNWSVTTGADGAFSFELFTGFVTVNVTADGYLASAPDVVGISPNKTDIVKNYELGVGGFSVLTPNVDVTVPSGDLLTVNAEIENTGTSPSPLFIRVDYSEGGEVIVTNQIYGLTGVGTTTPEILLIDEFTFTVNSSVQINLPTGKFAHDFTFLDGEIWILTHNSNGVSTVLSYDVTDWSLVKEVDLDIRNATNVKSVEALHTITYPSPTADNPDATVEVLAATIGHAYYNERVYQINPYAEAIEDLTVYIGEVPVFFGGFFYYDINNYRLQTTNARNRGTFFVSEDTYIYEFSIAAGAQEGDDEAEDPGDLSNFTVSLESEKWLGQFQEYEFFDFPFGYGVNFPLASIQSMTYFDTNLGLYVLTNSTFSNVLRLNYDSEETIEIFDAPDGLDRLTSSSTGISLDWLTLGYDTGSIGRNLIAGLPLSLNATELTDGTTRIATIRVRAPLIDDEQFITVNMVVGDLTQLPGFVEWYQQFFLTDPGADASVSDIDGDNIEAAIEYVVGGDPTKNDNANGGLPSVVLDPNTNDVFMKFNRRIDLPDDVLVIKGADSLLDPMVELVEGVDYELVSVTPIDNEIEEVLISTGFNGSGFFSLEIDI